MLEIYLLNLKSDLELRPSRSLILAAAYMVEMYPRVCLPDWVEALAGGDPNNWESVLEVARTDIEAEKKALMQGNQYGRSIPEYGIFLMLAAIVCAILYALLAPMVGMAVAGTMDQIAANITYDQPATHALLKHGPDAVAVEECIGRKGVRQEWTNPTNGRRAQICQMDDGRWGLKIIEEDARPVTAFIKNKMTDLAQIFQYLRNSGYIPPQ